MVVELLRRHHADRLRQLLPQFGELAVHQHAVARLGLRSAAGTAGGPVWRVGAGHDHVAGQAMSRRYETAAALRAALDDRLLRCRSDVDAPAQTGTDGSPQRRTTPLAAQAHAPAQRPDLRIRRRSQPDQRSANRTE